MLDTGAIVITAIASNRGCTDERITLNDVKGSRTHPVRNDEESVDSRPPGAGKSTIALRLGERLDYPVIHLDEHFWKPGWEMPSMEEWIDTQRELVRSSET